MPPVLVLPSDFRRRGLGRGGQPSHSGGEPAGRDANRDAVSAHGCAAASLYNRHVAEIESRDPCTNLIFGPARCLGLGADPARSSTRSSSASSHGPGGSTRSPRCAAPLLQAPQGLFVEGQLQFPGLPHHGLPALEEERISQPDSLGNPHPRTQQRSKEHSRCPLSFPGTGTPPHPGRSGSLRVPGHRCERHSRGPGGDRLRQRGRDRRATSPSG